ncbi:hypothetical protein GP486_004854 [Trichoglossum hirsutum]|uniref:Mitochondrial K+-H+ exchange-related-domain-containing protein n=1 Tax=Trichoglossum hirsutum TaxID=265104 RepID=A0A9P8LAE3_9PEZI|nr:hypothetical protein GP486_004854 [Trichoglossum hirsutum]
MRLFLLPISTKRVLIYCEKSSKFATDRNTLLDKATAKAAQIWVQWEKSNKKWQQNITAYGNRAFQRIPFEEWGLKSIPPLSSQRRAGGMAGEKVEVTFPPTLIKPESTQTLLRKLGTERQSLHRKRMWWSIAGMPITIPLVLVPIIPNIPFFYLCFRAWSHWRALSGSYHLEFLLDNNLIKPLPSLMLDELYSAGMSHKSEQWQRTHTDPPAAGLPKQNSDSCEEPQRLGQQKELVLVQPWKIRLIAQSLEVPELHPELERALRQVEKSLEAGAVSNDDRRKSDATTTKDKEKRE